MSAQQRYEAGLVAAFNKAKFSGDEEVLIAKYAEVIGADLRLTRAHYFFTPEYKRPYIIKKMREEIARENTENAAG